jgi:cell division protease FtsH
MSKREMECEIVTLLGGRVSEKLILGDISTGASNDIQRVTSLARNMVTRYGMSDNLGPIVYGSEHGEDEVFLGRDFSTARNYSEETASKIDDEIKRIVDNAYSAAQKILEEHKDKLHFIAAYLFKNEIMEEEQFNAVMNGDPTVEELEAMIADKRRRSDEENQARAMRDEDERRRHDEERAKREADLHKNGESGMDAYARLSRKEDKNDKNNRGDDK